MRILIATGLYPPDIGGPATYTRFLERVLPAHGHSLSVVSFSSVRHFPKVVRHVVYLWKLLCASRRNDVIYALDTVSVGVPSALVSILLRKPLYLRVPGDYAWEQGQQRFGVTQTLDEYLSSKRQPRMVRLLAWFQYRVAGRATKIVVPSEYMRGVVEQWGIEGSKIIRVYSALSPIVLPESKESLRAKYNYRGIVVTTAARLVPWKGVEGLCEAIIALKEQGMDISLEIIGDGASRADLEAFVQKHAGGEYITFCGSVKKQELWERVKASDVFVLNTAYEGLSHQLLEVMDIGTPIITTPVGGNVELIENEKEGILVAFNDIQNIAGEIARLAGDASVGERITREARAKVAHFREDVIGEEVVKLFL